MMRFVRLRILTNSRLGIRGSALLAYGLFHLLYSIQQFWPTHEYLARGDVQYRSQFLEPMWFGWVWIVVGLLCIANAFTRKDAVGYGATTALFTLWSLTSLGAWVDGSLVRGWTSASTWALMAVLALIFSRVEEPAKIEEVIATETEIDPADPEVSA